MSDLAFWRDHYHEHAAGETELIAALEAEVEFLSGRLRATESLLDRAAKLLPDPDDLRRLIYVAEDFAVWYGHGFPDGRPDEANAVLEAARRLRATLEAKNE
jgi:hypothetical protein